MSKLILIVFLFGLGITPIVYAGEGHDAGYQWAEEHGITDVNYDNGNSESFNEGVREYAEEQQQNQSEE